MSRSGTCLALRCRGSRAGHSQTLADLTIRSRMACCAPRTPRARRQVMRGHANNRGADAEATRQEIALNREINLAIMKSDDATAQARLQGESLYFRKMQDDIRETTLELVNQGKAAEIPARVREINEKYFNDLSE